MNKTGLQEYEPNGSTGKATACLSVCLSVLYVSHGLKAVRFCCTMWNNFLFCHPCISIHPCDEKQLVALFILSLFRQSTSTCFGHICSPSSGGILYIYNNWYVLGFSVDSIPSDDGLQTCPKHVEVDWRNKRRINSASSWLSSHGCETYATHLLLQS